MVSRVTHIFAAPLVLLLKGITCLSAAGFSYVENGSLYVNETVSRGMLKAFKKSTIRRIQVNSCVTGSLFTDPNALPQLRTVSIIDSPALDLELSLLTKNYRRIRFISISDKNNLLENNCLARLSFLNRLRTLGLHGNIAEPAILTRTKLPKLEVLTIGDGNLAEVCAELPVMPSLVSLKIFNCRLGPGFLQAIRAEKVRSVYLYGVTVESGALELAHLQRLKIQNSRVSIADLECLSSLEKLSEIDFSGTLISPSNNAAQILFKRVMPNASITGL